MVVYDNSNTLVLVLDVFDIRKETRRITHGEKYIGLFGNKIRFDKGNHMCVKSNLSINTYCGKALK